MPTDDDADRAQALAEGLTDLMAVAFGQAGECGSCRRLREMDRPLNAG